ncbi:MAG: MliC family protein [Minisyncoccia bacterium]
MKKIEWNKVTKFSQIIAIVLFVLVYFYGFYLGSQVRTAKIFGEKINDIVFVCDAGKNIHAVFYKQGVHIWPANEEDNFLLQTISASGARYANSDESLVFWNKGDGGFIMRNDQVDPEFKNCKTK